MEPSVEYASFNRRILASIIDTMLSIIVVVPAYVIFDKIFGFSDTYIHLKQQIDAGIPLDVEEAKQLLLHSMPSTLFESLALAIVVLIFWIYRNATPGKIMLSMRIVDIRTLDHPSKGQLIARYLGYFVSCVPLFLGFVWVAFDKKRQGWHDKIAKTAVILEPRE